MEQNKSNAARGLFDLFTMELKDILWAERAIVKTLPKMRESVTSEELRNAISHHLEETEKQVSRLEEVFSSLDMKVEDKKCEAMAGLIKEGEEIKSETDSGEVRDAGIIIALQKVEHYEIASYGSLVAFARTLHLDDKVISLLMETLEEEKHADSTLNELASSINTEAMEAAGDTSEE